MDLTRAEFKKATKSSSNGGACVEVATNLPGVVLVRDSKDNGAGPVLSFTREEWAAFADGMAKGEFGS